VCIGLVATKEGLPIAFEIFDGNRTDVTTTQEMVEIMEAKYGKAGRVWVLDRGMVSEDNLAFMRNSKARYLVGTPKSLLKKFERHLLDQNWIKSPKFYIGDAGLACYLAGLEDISDDPLKGAMVETYVAQNIIGILDAAWPQASLFFWNIQGRHEVDFIIEAGNRCIAIEVKAAARWEQDDLAGLRAFIAATPHCAAGILAYNGSTPVSLGEKLWAIPLSMVLS
jgi:hypothetical protein